MQYCEIYNGGEINGLGCGYRRLFVREGNKFVYLFYWPECEFYKLPLKDWQRLRPIPVGYNKTTIIRHITHYSNLLGIKTKQLKQIKNNIKQG